jgi:hypothetical protein
MLLAFTESEVLVDGAPSTVVEQTEKDLDR